MVSRAAGCVAAADDAFSASIFASHGYVVATSPSQSRIDGPPREGDSVVDVANEQATDLRFILETLSTVFMVDRRRVGIVAHSFGARSAFLLLLQTKIEAFVSLDGGIANRQGKDWLSDLDFDPTAVETPVLHFFQDVDEVVQPDFDLLESLDGSQRFIVRVDSLFHPHFTSLGLVMGLVPDVEIGPPSPRVVEKVVGIYELTLRFLDAYLRRPGSRLALEEALGDTPDFLGVSTLRKR